MDHFDFFDVPYIFSNIWMCLSKIYSTSKLRIEMRFGAPDIPDTSYWAHAWFELPRDRAAVPAVRGLNLKEPNSVRDRFLQHLFNPPPKWVFRCLLWVCTCRWWYLHFAFILYIYIYIIGFSADDLKKLQHMLIASKYRVILAEIVYVYLFLWTHVEKKNIYNYIYVCVSAVVHMFCLHINTHTHTYHIYLRSNITCKHDT